MQILQARAQAPRIPQDVLQSDPMASSPEDAAFLEQFRPAPLSWLVQWMFRSHRPQPVSDQDEFEEHINGLA